MRSKKVVFLLLLLTGCGIHVSSDPVRVDPVTVNHVISIDTAELEAFFRAYCSNLYTSQSDINTCVNNEMAVFWDALNNVVPGQVAPNPSPSPTPTP